MPLASTLISIPIFLEIYGNERYGVVTLLWLLVGTLGLFDLGIGPAVTILLSRRKRNVNAATFRYIRSAMLISLLIGLASAVLILLAVNQKTITMVGITENLYAEFKHSLLLLLFIIPLSTTSSVLTGLLAARERFFAINVSNIISTFVFQWLPLVLVYVFPPSVALVVCSITLAKILQFTILLTSQKIGIRRPLFKKIRMRETRIILGIGSWISVSKACAPVISATDRYVISSSVGVASIATYNLPYQIAEKIALFATTVTTLLVPKLSNKSEDYKDLVGQISQYIMVWISISASAIGGLLIYPFLDFWVGAVTEYDFGLVPALLVLGFSLNVLAYVPFTHMQTNNKANAAAYLHLVELPIYLLLSIALTVKFGITGTAVAFVLRILADTLIMSSLSDIKLNRLLTVYLPIFINLSLFGLINYGFDSSIGQTTGTIALLLLVVLMRNTLQEKKKLL